MTKMAQTMCNDNNDNHGDGDDDGDNDKHKNVMDTIETLYERANIKSLVFSKKVWKASNWSIASGKQTN